MKKATCSSSARPVAAAFDSRIATRISSSGGSSATVNPQPKREISRSSMPGDLLRIGVAGDDDLLVRLDQRVEQVEELFLRAALAAEELDVVDQQQIERAVVALEVVEGLVLVGAHDVGDVGLGVDVADLRGRIAAEDVVADAPAPGASCRARRRRRRKAGCTTSGARRPASPPRARAGSPCRRRTTRT